MPPKMTDHEMKLSRANRTMRRSHSAKPMPGKPMMKPAMRKAMPMPMMQPDMKPMMRTMMPAEREMRHA